MYSHVEPLPEDTEFLVEKVGGISWESLEGEGSVPLVSCEGLFGDIDDLTYD